MPTRVSAQKRQGARLQLPPLPLVDGEGRRQDQRRGRRRRRCRGALQERLRERLRLRLELRKVDGWEGRGARGEDV